MLKKVKKFLILFKRLVGLKKVKTFLGGMCLNRLKKVKNFLTVFSAYLIVKKFLTSKRIKKS